MCMWVEMTIIMKKYNKKGIVAADTDSFTVSTFYCVIIFTFYISNI